MSKNKKYLNDDGTDKDLEDIDTLLNGGNPKEILAAARELLAEVETLRNTIGGMNMMLPPGLRAGVRGR